jgi:hypothetical protein
MSIQGEIRNSLFDVDKQVFMENIPEEARQKDQVLNLPTGVVSLFENETSTNLMFAPYSPGAEKWQHEVKIEGEIADSPYTNGYPSKPLTFIRWEDKNYVVFQQVVTASTEGSGLNAGGTTTTYNTYVLDAETGEEANKMSVSITDSDREGVFLPVASRLRESSYLLTRSAEGNDLRMVNPLTGETVATGSQPTSEAETPYYTSEGFDRYGELAFENETMLTGLYFDYGLFRDNESGSISLVNTVTGEQIAETTCDIGEGFSTFVVHSEDFRFVSFGSIAFDTETGASFCGDASDGKRAFAISGVDNDGNLYGTADSADFLKVSFDAATVEQSDGDMEPIAIMGDGSGVFNTDAGIVTVPPKG